MQSPVVISEKELIEKISYFTDEPPLFIGICGLPGSGKTTLAKSLTAHFMPRAMQVSEDDFCFLSTSKRKEYLLASLAGNNLEKLRYLAAPKRTSDNPYANPLSWYDWKDIKQCLEALRSGHSYKRDGCWNQQTGECDKAVQYVPPKEKKFWCFVDTNYPLEYRNLIDVLVLIDINPKQAIERQALRDSHRSDKVYLAYKQMIDELYVQPYVAKVRANTDFILSLS